MNRLVKILVFVAGIIWMGTGASEVRAQVHVNINIGPPPVFSLPRPPQLAVIPGTYVYGVPGAKVDLFFYQGRWYRPHGGHWFSARSYNGPWVHLPPPRVPRPLLVLPPPGHRFAPGHRVIHYNHVKANWKKWERERHWGGGHREPQGHHGGDWNRGPEAHGGGGHKGRR